ncbi:heme exporter protein CcmB [Thermohalobaculum xanthum]|uniref:heme exporter protein CcmB n=1 Tax=Thermohalobaculum xanthum TaxID=2753746 RepID=UPI002D80F292|nr:heme exporter protein CcmB [Thermohalobaculum xanthum]
MRSPFAALVRRDTRLALRLGGGGAVGIAFFVLAVVLIPLGVGREAATLARIAGGVLWVAALLAALLSLDRLFQADFEDGSLDQLMLAPMPLEQVVLAKTLAHWVTTGLPMTLIAPVLGAMLQLPDAALPWLAIAMAVGTPALSFIGAIGAAITVGVRRGGLLLSILVLPLYIPTLVFGARVVENALLDLSVTGVLGLLGGLTLFAAALAPFAAAAALRINAR